jgi:hypothetical protein
MSIVIGISIICAVAAALANCTLAAFSSPLECVPWRYVYWAAGLFAYAVAAYQFM